MVQIVSADEVEVVCHWEMNQMSHPSEDEVDLEWTAWKNVAVHLAIVPAQKMHQMSHPSEDEVDPEWTALKDVADLDHLAVVPAQTISKDADDPVKNVSKMYLPHRMSHQETAPCLPPTPPTEHHAYDFGSFLVS
jgi:hypothetical protein